MNRALNALRTQATDVYRSPSTPPPSNVKGVLTLISGLHDRSLLARFKSKAFDAGKPVRISVHAHDKENYEDSILNSPFPHAQRWFRFYPHAPSSAPQPAPRGAIFQPGKHLDGSKWGCSIRGDSELNKWGSIYLPYELALSRTDTDQATSIGSMWAFRATLDEKKNWLERRKVKLESNELDLSSFLPENSFKGIETGVSFNRFYAPLQLLIEADKKLQAFSSGWVDKRNPLISRPMRSLYIAQAQISELPPPLRSALPTPRLVLEAGKGDIYDANIWLGIPPTYTPLHKDPNPNLFVQIINTKIVRLFKPEKGKAIFDAVQRKVGGHAYAAIRGEEMMQGEEREALHDAVWDCPNDVDVIEVTLYTGDALYIPQGWWHSIKSVGEGVNFSVNWWFR